MFIMAKMPKSEKGHNSVKYSQNLQKVQHVSKQYAYHDSNSSGSPGILLTSQTIFHRFTMQKSKRGIVQ